MPSAPSPPAVCETPDCSLCGEGRGGKLILPDGTGRPEAVPLDQPGRVVGFAELEQGLPQLLDGVEAPHPEQVFLEGADEAPGASVPLGGAHEGGRALDAEEAQLLPEGVGHVLRAVVVPDGEAAGDALGEAAEVAAHALAQRLEGLEAGGAERGGGAHAPRAAG